MMQMKHWKGWLSALCLTLLMLVAAGCGNSDTAPTAVSGVTATAADGQVSLSWSAVSGATSYNIYYGTSTGVTAASPTKVAGAAGPQAVTGLTNGTTYHFVVTAVNAVGESTLSTEVSATPLPAVPAAPTGLVATPADGQVTLTWTAVTGATSYNVYYGTAAGVSTASTKVAGATSGQAISLINGTAYHFVVTAVNLGGESVLSSEVTATPNVAVPVKPAGIIVSAGDSQVTIVWTASAGATSYNVYYATSAGVTTSNSTKVTGVTSGQTISSLTNGVT